MKPHSDKWKDACATMMGFTPNDTQAAIANWWFGSDARLTQILGGERGGKSLMASYFGSCCMNIEKPRSDYWIVGPDYQQPRQEFAYIYNAFKDGIGGVSLIKPESVSMPVGISNPWSFETIWGQTWRTRSSSDIQKLASFSVSGAIMAEAAQQVYEVYLKLMGRIAETNGFLILSGTLERGLPWYGDLYTRWQGENDMGAKSWSLPTWSNTAIFPGGREDPRIKELEAEYPEDLFNERFGAIPSRKQGLVLPEFDMAKHVKHLQLDPDKPVELAIDPGQHCYAILFCQFDGLVCNVLDAVYERNKIVQDIIPIVMANPLFKYVELDHAGVIDNAGKQHQANKSQVELWQELAGCSLRAQYHRLDDTIQAVRLRLRDHPATLTPLLYFDARLKNTKSPDGLAMDVLAEPELWAWPDRAPSRNVAVTPVDRNNDAMKALGYLLLDRYGTNITRKVTTRGRRRAYLI